MMDMIERIRENVEFLRKLENLFNEYEVNAKIERFQDGLYYLALYDRERKYINAIHYVEDGVLLYEEHNEDRVSPGQKNRNK